MGFLREWILNIVVTMIFVTIVEILMPSGSTRKYISLVIGLMVMFVIISPFVSIMAGEFDLGLSIQEASRAISLRDVSMQVKSLEEGNKEGIVTLYKSNLAKQIEDDIVNAGLAERVQAEVVVNGEYGTDSFGSITGIRVVIMETSKADTQDGVIKVEKVEVKVDTHSDEQQAAEPTKQKEQRQQQTAEFLADTYNLPVESIEIVLQ